MRAAAPLLYHMCMPPHPCLGRRIIQASLWRRGAAVGFYQVRLALPPSSCPRCRCFCTWAEVDPATGCYLPPPWLLLLLLPTPPTSCRATLSSSWTTSRRCALPSFRPSRASTTASTTRRVVAPNSNVILQTHLFSTHPSPAVPLPHTAAACRSCLAPRRQAASRQRSLRRRTLTRSTTSRSRVRSRT
jgi:hypothetical protein